MSNQYIAETQQLIKFIEKQPFSAEEKARWLETLHENGIDQTTMDEVHQKFLEMPKDKFTDDWQHAKANMELTALIKKWRLDQASKNFRRSR